jgi:signal peptidase II
MSSDAPARSGGSRQAWLAPAVVLGVVAADQLTKAWVVATLSDRPLSVVGTVVELRVSRNRGSAFSVVRGFTPVLALIAVAVAVVLVRVMRRTADRWLVVGLSLVLGGATGNLVDRFARAPGVLRGGVVDFVHVGWWPSFNVADSAITIGALILVAHAWRRPPPEAER